MTKETDRKRAFNAANYDRIEITVPKGQRQLIQEAAAASEEKTVNKYINNAILQRMGMDKWPE